MSDTSNTYPGLLNSFDEARATGYLVTAANWNALHGSVNDLEAKLGIGADTAAADEVLKGTGAGASAWAKIVNANVDAAAAIDASKIAVGVFGGSGMTTFPSGAYFGDTSNANMTIGLTINQGANDNEIIALKSSDVAHGVTGVAETDTFARFQKYSPTDGGLTINGFTETATGIQLGGVVTTEDNGRSTAGVGALIVDGFLKSGTSVGNMSADRNIIVFRNNGATAALVTSSGRLYLDDTSNASAWDAYEDAKLVRAFDIMHGRGVIESEWDQFVQYNKADLIAAGILGEDGPNGERGLVCYNAMMHLHNGAIWQLQRQIWETGERLKAAESRLALLGAA